MFCSYIMKHPVESSRYVPIFEKRRKIEDRKISCIKPEATFSRPYMNMRYHKCKHSCRTQNHMQNFILCFHLHLYFFYLLCLIKPMVHTYLPRTIYKIAKRFLCNTLYIQEKFGNRRLTNRRQFILHL